MKKIVLILLLIFVKIANGQENLYFLSGNTGYYINFYTKVKPTIFSYDATKYTIDTLMKVNKSDSSYFSSIKVYNEFGLIAINEVVQNDIPENYLHLINTDNFNKSTKKIDIRGNRTFLINSIDSVFYCITTPDKTYKGYNNRMEESNFTKEKINDAFFIGKRTGILFEINDGLRITRKDKNYYLNFDHSKLQLNVPEYKREEDVLYRSFDYLLINNNFISCILLSNSIPNEEKLGSTGYFIYDKIDNSWYYQTFK